MGEEKTVLPPEAPRDLALVPGDTIAGHRIVKLLGRGGMGEVYQAEVIATGERCALKLLPEAFCRDPGAVARFRREAKVMAGLNHPNLVRVVDSGDDDGRLWLRMELIEAGEGGRIMTLADLAHAFDGKIQQQELVDILSQVLAGLACAHDRGVIHRDLKPGNILLCEADGRTRVKVTDFGLAKVVGEEWLRSQAEISVRLSMSLGDQRTRADPLDVTRTGALLGTYEYMSPEQKRGAEADARSDLYAVGLTAYRLLTGRPLGLRQPSEIDPDLIRGWDAFIARALEDRPEDRYATATDMLAALTDVHSAISSPSTPKINIDVEFRRKLAARQAQKRKHKRQRALALAAALLLLLLWWNRYAIEAAFRGWYWQAVPDASYPNPAGLAPGSAQAQQRQRATAAARGLPVEIRIAKAGIRLRLIPAGKTVNQPFYLGKFEVTQREWETVMGDRPSKNTAAGATAPVESITFAEAEAFCRKLCRIAGAPRGTFRLPKKSQWRYAQQAGTTAWYHTGESRDSYSTAGWLEDNSGRVTHPVGKLVPNAWGLYDMHGNVQEFCSDSPEACAASLESGGHESQIFPAGTSCKFGGSNCQMLPGGHKDDCGLRVMMVINENRRP